MSEIIVIGRMLLEDEFGVVIEGGRGLFGRVVWEDVGGGLF